MVKEEFLSFIILRVGHTTFTAQPSVRPAGQVSTTVGNRVGSPGRPAPFTHMTEMTNNVDVAPGDHVRLIG